MTSRPLACAALAASLALAGCTAAYAPTPVPSRPADPEPGRVSGWTCEGQSKTYPPAPTSPLPPGSTMAKLADRGRLVVGVSSDALPLGTANTANGDLEGFEVDLARGLARAMFGDESKVELRVIRLSDLQASLDNGDVDVAVRQVGASCARWKTMRFSAPYASVPIRVLSRQNAVPADAGQLAGRRVCAVDGSDAAALVAEVPAVRLSLAATDTACMVRFQRGEVDAVAGTNPVMQGLARQDPYARVADFDIARVDLAVAARPGREDLVAWVNGVLAQRAGGAWTESWNRWVRPYAGEAQPPRPDYGRAR